MRYIINSTICFTVTDNSLRITEQPAREQQLPPPATLLLQVLVENPRVIISRHMLMEEAWDKRGYTVSGHNLNNYLSIIRTAMAELGQDKEIIKTIHRQGLILQSDVEKVSDECSAGPDMVVSHSDIDNLLPSHSSHQDSVISNYSRTKIHTIVAFITLSLIMFYFAYFFISVSKPNPISSVKSYRLGTNEQCDIFSIFEDLRSEKEHISAQLQSQEVAPSCKSHPGIIWVAYKNLKSDNIVSVSHCYKSDSGFDQCANTYVHEEN